MTSCKVDIKNAGDEQIVFLSGSIDENSDLRTIERLTADRVTIDFGGVSKVNSFGIRMWINVLKNINDGRNIVFENCTSVFIENLNIIPKMREDVEIMSFFLPFYCSACDIEIAKRVTRKEALEENFIESLGKKYVCSKCDRLLEFYDDEDLYFDFLTD